MSAQTEPHWTQGRPHPLKALHKRTTCSNKRQESSMMSTEERLPGPTLTGEDGVEAAPMDWFLDGLMDLGGGF